MKARIAPVIRTLAALSVSLAFFVAHDGATARDRDHAQGGTLVRDHRAAPIVRDHRTPVVVRDHRTQPIVRDHRTQPIVRDHRADPIVRDHRTPRGPQGGVTVTSSGDRRDRSPCIRSVFGGPCFGL